VRLALLYRGLFVRLPIQPLEKQIVSLLSHIVIPFLTGNQAPSLDSLYRVLECADSGASWGGSKAGELPVGACAR
jgi:hypothetical protein